MSADAAGSPPVSWSVRFPWEMAREILSIVDAAKAARPSMNRSDAVLELVAEALAARRAPVSR